MISEEMFGAKIARKKSVAKGSGTFFGRQFTAEWRTKDLFFATVRKSGKKLMYDPTDSASRLSVFF